MWLTTILSTRSLPQQFPGRPGPATSCAFAGDDGSRQRAWTKTLKALRHSDADRAADEKLMKKGFLRRMTHPSSSDGDDGSRQRAWTRRWKATLRHFAVDRADDHLEAQVQADVTKEDTRRDGEAGALGTAQHKPATESEPDETPGEARPSWAAQSDTTNARPEIADSIGEAWPSGTGDGCPRAPVFEVIPRTGLGDTATAAPTAAKRVDDTWPLGTAKCTPATVSETAESLGEAARKAAKKWKVLRHPTADHDASKGRAFRKKADERVGESELSRSVRDPNESRESKSRGREIKSKQQTARYCAHATDPFCNMVGGSESRVLIIGGQFSGNFSRRELKERFHVAVVDAKEEFSQYTPGVLRANVKPAH